MAKKTIWQRDFSFMETRSDLLEAADSEIRSRSVKSARNMRRLATNVLTARPGLFFMRHLQTQKIFEVQPADGLRFGVALLDDQALILNETAGTLVTLTDVPWSAAENLWVLPFRQETLIGDPETGIYKLVYSSGSWSIDEWLFEEAPGGERYQPYWVFNKSTSITPSAREGEITVEADAAVFTADHVGTYIRYGQREIRVDAYVTSQIIQGTVISKLPPSYRIKVSDAADFRVGEAVTSRDTNYQGIIIAVDTSANTVDVVTTAYYEGPETDEYLASDDYSSEITAVTEIDPLASTIWDEQLMSQVHGWPRAATAVAGRLILIDFPDAPSVVAVSNAASIQNFDVGTEDDDAIVREVGDDSPRFLHAISANDLLLLSDRGCYWVNVRDNGVLTPSTFNAIKFDKRGASSIPPVLVDDSVVFVESNGEGISAATLSGSSYLKWSITPLTLYHNQLVNSPVALCGPAINSPQAEKYLFVVNADGTLAAVSWSTTFGEETVSFAPWDTQGTFINVFPMFDTYWAMVDRDVATGTVRMLERFDTGIYLDSAKDTSEGLDPSVVLINGEELTIGGDSVIISQGNPTHLPGLTVSILRGVAYVGEFEVNDSGELVTNPGFEGQRQIGLNYSAEVSPWPAEATDSPRSGMRPTRVTRFLVSMQGRVALQIRANGYTRSLGGYSFGDDLSVDPPQRDQVYRVMVAGRRDHPDMAVIKNIPGPFTVLALGQEVKV
ncbi:hypothetical protein KM176_16475 [Pseudooceanicola sp. CBS1P-1]|uniref:Uncharacterized protein n=1 Tax=Pseudooceanicola albus TaxID=2692189 RepID=A0A6L7G6G6_9RHOB|nr:MULTISPECIES: hypothetical protein [Pseudooceanicola]MBT9385471.1 hypothetical protein [Pseudooceanicola endophyticus]MXN19117.1 hypothetical protein [Pseudooceanicola albus]